MRMPLVALLAASQLAGGGISQAASGTWDVFQTGARGDGKTLETGAIQRSIDACAKAGGGRVYLHNGTFCSGTLYLKSHVELEITAGATLVGSTDEKEYPRKPSAYPGYDGELLTGKALIYAEDATDISIGGLGTIDGNGNTFDEKEPRTKPAGPSFNYRPRILNLVHCNKVHIRDVTLRNSGSWVECYDGCNDLVVTGITVNSPNGRNKDGMDLVDCSRVRVSNCNIVCSDDGICLKSFDPQGTCRDIEVSNCSVSTPASGLKIGTETSGLIENILIQNCSVYDTRDAIAIQSVDGAQVENVIVSNIAMRNIWGTAISIRRAARDRPYRKGAKINAGLLRGITLENIRGAGIGKTGSSIVGLPDRPIEDVLIRDVYLTSAGGGTAADAVREIAKLRTAYPMGGMYGTLPAYGFFIRDVNELQLEDVHLALESDDARAAIVAINTRDFENQGLVASPKMKNTHAILTEAATRTPQQP